MSAPIYEIKKNYEVQDYTLDNFIARQEWNKEIANNKQGYMGVDIMSMKDFYDAGGYTFVDDYRAELQQIDTEYDRALPGYGVKGEQMASAGLTGSGFGDYLSGQAYAARAKGQALARQNIMANSNSFRVAYNSYVTQQKEKREENLKTVIEKAYNSAMDPEMFVEMATKLGIPQADAERGKGVLEGYYMGYGVSSQTMEQLQVLSQNAYNFNMSGDAFKEYLKANGITNETAIARAETMLNALHAATPRNEIGLTNAEQQTMDALYNQIMAGLENGVASIDSALASLQGTYSDSGGKLLEMAKNKAANVIKTDLLARIQNKGEIVQQQEIDQYVSYGLLDETAVGEINTALAKLKESGKGEYSDEVKATADAIAQELKLAMNEKGGSYTTIGANNKEVEITIPHYKDIDEYFAKRGLSDLDEETKKLAIEKFQETNFGSFEYDVTHGKYVSKSALDEALQYKAITEEQHETILGMAQKQNAGKLLDAIKSGYADDQIAALEYLGVDISSADENNCEELLTEAVEEAYKNGDITREQKNEFDEARWQRDISIIQDLKDLEMTILTIKQQKGTIEETAKCFNITGVSYGKYNHKNGFDINLYTESGTKITVPVLLNSNAPMEATKKISAEIESAVGENHDNVVQYQGALYTKKNGYWYSLKIDDGKNPIEANNSKSPIKDWLYQFFGAEALKARNKKTASALGNTLNVVKK